MANYIESKQNPKNISIISSNEEYYSLKSFRNSVRYFFNKKSDNCEYNTIYYRKNDVGINCNENNSREPHKFHHRFKRKHRKLLSSLRHNWFYRSQRNVKEAPGDLSTQLNILCDQKDENDSSFYDSDTDDSFLCYKLLMTRTDRPRTRLQNWFLGPQLFKCNVNN